ncbi:hypothetical protein MRX96_024002 [Rhipicephalus microplus]
MGHYMLIVNGKDAHIPRDVPALKKSAIPTIFPNLRKYTTKTLPKERNSRIGQRSSVPAKKSREDIDDSERESVQLIPHDELDIFNDEVPRKHFIFGLRLPSEYWSCQTLQNKNIASYQTAEHYKSKVHPVAFNKIAVFEIGEQNSPSCTIFLAGHLHCQRTVEFEDEAQELLVYAGKLSVCCGVGNTSEFKRLDVSDCTTLSANGLFSTVCYGSVSQGMPAHMSQRCLKCRKVRRILMARLLRLKNKAFKAFYGFSRKLLECVKEKASEINKLNRHGGLVIDEMKLSTHLDLKSSIDIEGFVNLGQFTGAKDKHTKADHGLVVMLQPFVGKWTQIIGLNQHAVQNKARKVKPCVM